MMARYDDMDNRQYIQAVTEMDMPTLLQEILDNPDYLIDHYYSELGRALTKRANELIDEGQE